MKLTIVFTARMWDCPNTTDTTIWFRKALLAAVQLTLFTLATRKLRATSVAHLKHNGKSFMC